MEGKRTAWCFTGTYSKHTNFFIQITILFFILVNLPLNDAAFSMTILHTSDIHARFQEADKYAGTCSVEESDNGECYGGFARLASAIKDTRQAENNVVLLDAGDVFQGTLWFTVYKGRASSYFMNLLGYDAQAVGNHEFDIGPSALADYLRELNASAVSANMDVSQEPVLEDHYTPSVVLTVGGERIGVIGYVLPRTKKISRGTGKYAILYLISRF
ncbi:protein 5NUC-like [Amphiura filiformis]|uniref:protein 5NUC-like n=1 Tax=Amphiura filiformis TaxID=82378 RepID=UPI003B211BF8